MKIRASGGCDRLLCGTLPVAAEAMQLSRRASSSATGPSQRSASGSMREGLSWEMLKTSRSTNVMITLSLSFPGGDLEIRHRNACDELGNGKGWGASYARRATWVRMQSNRQETGGSGRNGGRHGSGGCNSRLETCRRLEAVVFSAPLRSAMIRW